MLPFSLTPSTILQIISFLWIIIKPGRLVEIKGSVRMSNSPMSLRVSFSRTDVELCIHHLIVWLNFCFLHNYEWITLPTQPFIVLYSFCANLLHSPIMWLIVLSLSPHNFHLQFCCVLCFLALIWLVRMALLYTAIRRDPVYLSWFPFLSRIHVFSCEMSLVRSFKIIVRNSSCIIPKKN